MCVEAAAPFVGTSFSGIRISTRPDAIDVDELAFLKSCGVTAIELGAQSMDAEVLIKNERGHTPEDTVNAARLIKASGFNLGLQMMTGLYGSTDETDLATAEALIGLQPDTVRIYPTVVLEGTRLAEYYRSGAYAPPTLAQSVSLCAKLLLRFSAAGIPVIRLGLHAGADVEKSYVAGPYHPAFRELCEARIYRDSAGELLEGLPPGEYTLLVPPGHASKAAGQKRTNLMYFRARGYRLKIRETEGAEPYKPQIIKN
jgi:histone acetyltransferase (RNA polymerase elongator complex component)